MKTYPGINYDFAPVSYWSDLDPLAAILRNVKGANRRQMIRDAWAAGKLELLDDMLLRDELGTDVREQLGEIHPSFLGGEYLPGYFPGEVEIARITLQTIHADVISVRARPTQAGIGYRVVDEYEERFLLPVPTSKQPLSLLEMIRQLDEGSIENAGWPGGGLGLGYNIMNVESSNDVRERFRHFTTISSPFYRQLHDHYEKVFSDWVDTQSSH